MNETELAFLSAIKQAELIKNKIISPLELTNIYLKRIANNDSHLGSYYYIAAEMALEDAKNKTELLTKKENLPPFFGVPAAVKDLNTVANMPCSYGVEALKNNIPDYDEGVITKMKLAGFTILGKTATSQVGSFPFTECPGFPPSRNPRHLDYTSGGSSGGSAAAVAAGLCSVAHGSDGGGSIRIPAACCGVVGIKPSRGRISQAPVGDRLNGIATQGTIARTVGDAAALLDIMSGYITGDPYWLPDPEISFFEASQQTPPQLKVAFSKDIPEIAKCCPSYGEKIEEIAHKLSNLGHFVEESCPNIADLSEPFVQVWRAGVCSSSIPLELLTPLNQWLGEGGASTRDYLNAVAQMQIISRRIVAFFDNFDVLILPVLMHPPIKIGAWENLPFEETLNRIINWVAPCPLANASGLPAIAIPVGIDENNLPIAIQIIGKPTAEITIIALAAELEKMYPCNYNLASELS